MPNLFGLGVGVKIVKVFGVSFIGEMKFANTGDLQEFAGLERKMDDIITILPGKSGMKR
jgi:hypothetical protein